MKAIAKENGKLISEILSEIMKKAYLVNTNTENTVLIDFRGHINMLEIRIHYIAFSHYRRPDYVKNMYLDKKNTEKNLKEIKAELERLLTA